MGEWCFRADGTQTGRCIHRVEEFQNFLRLTSSAERLDERCIGETRLVAPALDLPLADSRARGKADEAIDLSDIVALALEPLLHGLDMATPERIHRLPVPDEIGGTTHAISEVTD